MSRRLVEGGEAESVSAALSADIARACHSLEALGDARGPQLPRALALIVEAVASEATRTARFATALQRALEAAETASPTEAEPGRPRRTGRRDPGVLDPFGIYSQGSEETLREQLTSLTLEQLRDIVAEHGMDDDRLAMKWKDPVRVIDRIVERVAARVAKGSAFRGDPPVDDGRSASRG